MNKESEEYTDEIRLSLGKTKKFPTDYIFISALVLVAIVAAISAVVHTNRVIARKASFVNCSNYQTQLEAQTAYHAAMTSGDPVQVKLYKRLDGRDHDGIACESLTK